MSPPVAALTLENVLYEKKDAIAYVTLNRPKVLNALNQGTWENLRTAFEDARDDAAVRGVILTGAGDKAFIAGADISELAHVTAVEAEKSSSYRTGGSRPHRESRQAGDSCGQRLCARRRLRDGDGLHHQDRVGEARSSASPKSRWDSFPAAVEHNACRGWSGRAAPCSSFYPER